ncbi:MAG: cobyric acid synthase [Desulfatibacillaceae bacterium]
MAEPASMARCLAVLGTGSDVGKSIVVTALCRILANRGVSVCPYKAQNMSNNSGVTPEGLEMGRAQIVQAEAARLAPHVDMNPVLLKPTGDTGSQVVLLGRSVGNQSAREYYATKDGLFGEAAEALSRLRAGHDAVVIEGAGSCAEINLMPHDIVNLRMAGHADAPVVLVADIHKGGVFAQIVGTLECLPQHHRDRIAGFVVNRFRGDASLFDDGVRWIEDRTDKPCFGVIPWFEHIRIEAEDSVVIERPRAVAVDQVRAPAVAVVRTPHISNFTDFDPLLETKGLSVHFVEQPMDLSPFAAVALPGSKNTRDDLEWLAKTGWANRIRNFHAGGGHVLGICGGYQMLGAIVRDPEGLEGDPGDTPGLGLLPVETVLAAPKTTTLARFAWDGIEGTGYEIHMGRTVLSGARVLFSVLEQNGAATRVDDGCESDDGRVVGTYMHGLFDEPRVLERWLSRIGAEGLDIPEAHGFVARDAQYDLLAEHFAANADVPGLLRLLGLEDES